MILMLFIWAHLFQLTTALNHICQIFFYLFNNLLNVWTEKKKIILNAFYYDMQIKILLVWILQYICFHVIFVLDVNQVNWLNATQQMYAEILCAFFFFLAYVLFFIYKNQTTNSMENLIFFYFLIVTSVFLLMSNNILQIFFLIEMLGFLILYSFLTFNLFFDKKTNQNVSLILNSTVNQFLLNFFSSVIFYCSIFGLLTYVNSTNILNSFLNFKHNYINIYSTLIVISLLIKFGSGPWIFFKINIYKNLTLNALLIYTIIYFCILMVIFFNFFLFFEIFFNSFLLNTSLLLLIFFAIIFAKNLFNYNTLTMFLGLSSLLNICFIVLQIFTNV